MALAMVLVLGAASLPASQAAPSRSELKRARERLMELEREFELVVEEYNATNERLTVIQARIGQTAKTVAEIERRMASKEKSAVAVAVELYKHGSVGALEAILSAESLAEMETRLTYLSSTEKAQEKIFEELAVDRAELEGKIAELEEAEARAAETKARLVALRSEIEDKVASQKDEIADLTAAIERAERRAAARFAAERRAQAAVARAAQPTPSAPVRTATASNPRAQAAVDAALGQVGEPYQWGGAGPDSFDCSGLTMWAWGQAGVALPHNSAMQYSATARVDSSDLQPGDLMFFGSPIHHVGMYIGGGRMVEAPYTGLQVRVVSSARSDFVGAGRPGV